MRILRDSATRSRASLRVKTTHRPSPCPLPEGEGIFMRPPLPLGEGWGEGVQLGLLFWRGFMSGF